jgi:hypothetical protein
MKKVILSVFIITLFLVWSNVGLAQIEGCDIDSLDFQDCFNTTIEETGSTDAFEVLTIFTTVGGFLMVAGGIIAGIVIIVAGIMWMAAGSNPTRVTSAKSTFKNGIIGALIVFAAGLIVNTIILLGTNWRNFFN